MTSPATYRCTACGREFGATSPAVVFGVHGVGPRSRLTCTGGSLVPVTVDMESKAGWITVGDTLIVDGRSVKVVSRNNIWLPKKNGRMHGVRLACDDGTELICAANKRLARLPVASATATAGVALPTAIQPVGGDQLEPSRTGQVEGAAGADVVEQERSRP